MCARRGAVVIGTAVLGAGVLGAGVLGAGALGAGVLGAGVLGGVVSGVFLAVGVSDGASASLNDVGAGVAGRVAGPPTVALALAESPFDVAAEPPVAARWVWPLGRSEVGRAFERPDDEYSAGHRGIDLPAAAGEEVVAPTAGVVFFAGVVVDRGVLSIRHADGTVSSFEPIAASVSAGDEVGSGQSVGRVSEGGHCDSACLHVGARVEGVYVDPEPYFSVRRRAVLVPLGDFARPR